MRRGVSVVVVAVLAANMVGCASSSAQVRLQRLEHRADADDAAIEDLSERVAAFEASVDELVGLYGAVSSELMAAEERLQRATALAEESAQAFGQAAAAYEAAEKRWRLVTISLLAAATWDYAGHLCSTRMTTAAYREQLKKKGINLDGLDADHGLPKSRGGADHPLNYRMIDSSLNRSLGNDVMRKLMAHPLHLLRGAVASALIRLRCSPRL